MLKNKNLKKAIAVIMTIAVLMSMSVNVFAEGNAAQPRYIACPNGGKHIMSANNGGGSGVVFDGDQEYAVRVYKCSGCSLYVACQYFPETDHYMGGYVASYSPDQMNGVFAFYNGFDGAYFDLQEDSFIQGFEWKH